MKIFQSFIRRFIWQSFKLINIFKLCKANLWIIDEIFIFIIYFNFSILPSFISFIKCIQQLFIFVFNYSSLCKSPSFLLSSFNLSLKTLLNGEYSNFACSIILGLRSKSSPVKYLYLFKLLEDNADILAAFLSKSYYASFSLIFLPKILIWSITVIFMNRTKIFSKY